MMCDMMPLCVMQEILQALCNMLWHATELLCQSLSDIKTLQSSVSHCRDEKQIAILIGVKWPCVQEERLRALYGKQHEEKGYLASIAEDMPGGFSKGQISSQLRKLGLKGGGGKEHKAKKRKSEVRCTINLWLLSSASLHSVLGRFAYMPQD